MKRVLVLYNTDYDEELTRASNVDVSEVRAAALAVHEAAAAFGFAAELAGVHGRDLEELISRLRRDPPDLVFNLCESLCGETRNEIVLPALLDMLHVPYTGPGSMAIGLCLNKDQTKAILHEHRISTPESWVIANEQALASPALREVKYPAFVKLLREDASIGIEPSNRAFDFEGLAKRSRELLAQFREPLLVERYIDGREVNATVMGNGETIEVLPLHEIDFSKMPADRPRVLTYAAKWDEKHVDYEGSKPVPMKNLSPAWEANIRKAAIDSFRALGLRDFGRVDMRVDAEGVPWVIDVNPNCDLSPDAGFARAAKASGLSYPQMIGRICELAWARFHA